MNKIKEKLIDLRNNHNISGIKIEFESEYFNQFELTELRKMASETGVSFGIKLGGFSSFKDIVEAEKLDSDIIIAPMIETLYAFEKFIKTYEKVYSDKKDRPELFISIETYTSVKNLSEIIGYPYFNEVSGIVLGRGDLSSSLNIKDVENNQIFRIAQAIREEITKQNKKMIIGGEITTESVDFLKKIKPDYTETRKIIFNGVPNRNAIEKAIAFESELISKKEEKTPDDFKRIEKLQERIKV